MDWIGVDVGGTFTDAVVYRARTRELNWSKAPSTPGDPSHGVLEALGKLGISLVDVDRIVHGITIGTNAIIERTGADVWVLTTGGFRDTLEIARTERTVLYNIKTLKQPPLVPRQHVLEVDERMMFDGSVRRPLNEDELRQAVQGLVSAEAVAVCFLHSYVNPAHERRAAEALTGAYPDIYVAASSEVLPEFREYERFTTAVLNAYIGPLMGRYLASLDRTLGDHGYRRQVYLMTSSGGVMTADRAGRFPIHTVLSGPAAGVAAAVELGRAVGLSNMITYDMGGTSTDVCLVDGGRAPITTEQFIAGYPNRTPQIEINSVGAGGGSIAWVDDGNMLKVGPQSAGAEPGPACYGRGGTQPTVTDANLLLGRFDANSRLASEIALDADRAAAAVAELSAGLPDLDPHRMAEGIVRIAVARMVSAIKEISIAKGHDPRDFTILAYGGAGPMHAAYIADELEIPRVVVPPSPGNFSAFGCLTSDLRYDYVQTRLMETRRDRWEAVENTFADMEAEGRAALSKDSIPAAAIEFRRELGMRYVGQSWELVVTLPNDLRSMAELEQTFQETHRRRYGHSSDDPAQIVSFRLAAIGRVEKPALPETASGPASSDASRGLRRTYFDGSFHEVPVYNRDQLPAEARCPGPALIEEMGSLTVIPPRWSGRLGRLGELHLTKDTS